MTRQITFLEPWGRHSWKVQYDGPYDNDRPPHVELGESNMNCVKAGDTFTLSNLHCSGNVAKGAVMWDVGVANESSRYAVLRTDPADVASDVKTVQNLRNPARPQKAHFTVYFGADAYDKLPHFV